MKKVLALLLCTTLVIGMFTGCAKDKDEETTTKTETETTEVADEEEAAEVDETAYDLGAGPIDLKLWGGGIDNDELNATVERFKAAYPDTTFNITTADIGADICRDEVLKDPAAAADVFSFASDQIAGLVDAKALYRVTKNKDQIIANNSPSSIQVATVADELYAYPSSNETYFLYYDKSLISDEEVGSLETIMAKETADGVYNFGVDINNGWYTAAFYLTSGAQLFGPDGLDPTICDFNSPAGVEAGNYLASLSQNPKFSFVDTDDILKAQFADRKLAAAVSGLWNSADIQTALGDDFGVAKLPTINLGGEDKQMTSFANYKLFGVNAQTKQPLAAMALAEFITNSENQKARFDKLEWAPTSMELINDEAALAAKPALAAQAQQAQFATLQPSIPQIDKFWQPNEAFGAGLMDGSINKDNMQEKLDELVDAILATLS